jgi:hypothetical protein
VIREKKQLPSQSFCQENKKNNDIKKNYFEGRSFIRGFSLFLAEDFAT